MEARSLGAFGLVALLFTNAYQSSDLSLNLGQNTITNHYHRTEGRGMTEYYVRLELVVYGAVELGDVVLTFVGIHGLTGLEVYARLGWHFY